MSFILDALKKSEAERQQSNTSEFAGVPTSPSKPSVPRWLWIVGFLLAINLAVLIGLLLQSDSPEANPSRPTVVNPPHVQQSAPTSFAEQAAAARQQPPVAQAMSEAEESMPEPAPNIQAELISQDPSAISADQLYPTIQEVRVSGTVNLPELHLDIHVFSPVPEDRFVFINMTKLREGSQMDEGPRVIEITPDGVILKHRNTSFVVPRE